MAATRSCSCEKAPPTRWLGIREREKHNGAVHFEPVPDRYSSTTTGPVPVLITQKFASLGGSQVSLIHTLRLLDRSRFAPHVVVSNTGWLTGQLDALSVPWALAKFGHATTLGALPANWFLVRKLRNYIRRHRIRLVHANEHWVGPQSLRAARSEGLPAICHFRTGLADLTPPRIRKYRYAEFDRVLVVAEVLRDALAPRMPDASRIEVVRDGVEPSPEEPSSRGARRTRVIVNVGAIYDVKGQAIILDRTLPWLKESRRHFLLFIGGTLKNPGYVEGMRRVVAEQGLQRQALFLGSREDVPRLLCAADALVAYSTVEGIPRVVKEAMFAGRPVQVSDTPGMSEVVTGEVGRVLSFDDATNPFGQALRDLAAHPARWESMDLQAMASRALGNCRGRPRGTRLASGLLLWPGGARDRTDSRHPRILPRATLHHRRPSEPARTRLAPWPRPALPRRGYRYHAPRRRDAGADRCAVRAVVRGAGTRGSAGMNWSWATASVKPIAPSPATSPSPIRAWRGLQWTPS